MRRRVPSSLLWSLGLLLLGACRSTEPVATPGEAWIRVNQIGYLTDDPKIAVLSSDLPLSGSFRVGEFVAEIGADAGAWGPFAHNYRLDFSALRTPGTYAVQVGDVRSPSFRIGGNEIYAEARERMLTFLRLQRCGENPVSGERCHQQDAIDTVTGEAIDLTGGWHDAGDRLKHMITTSYAVAALSLAGANDEACHGLELLERLQPTADTIYVQIGDDRDHQPPATLWHDDRTDYGFGPGGARSAWPALGEPQGPRYQNASTGVANLAGRTAAALALNDRLEKARAAYELALRKPGCAMSVPVRAPYYYGESTYHDDLEWAAVELYRKTGDEAYLQQAIEHAHEAGVSRWMGKDEHGHYEFFPYVNLAHWRLHDVAPAEVRSALATYYRTGLERIRAKALENPYRLGTPLVWCSTNDVIAAATQAVLYEEMTGDTTFRGLAAEARDWIFGRNPWGVSFVVGVPERGDAASQPHHLFWKLIGHLPAGGLVDGPVTKAINDGLKFADFGEDRLARFQSTVGVYHDVFEDFSTNEPILDGTVSLLLLLSVW